jgi:hypothetical protein
MRKETLVEVLFWNWYEGKKLRTSASKVNVPTENGNHALPEYNTELLPTELTVHDYREVLKGKIIPVLN